VRLPHTVISNSPLTNLTELINIHSAFHAGAFQQVLDFDTSSFSSSNSLPVRVLQLRSKIALGQAKDVSSELASEKTPDLVAVKLLADQDQGKDVLSPAWPGELERAASHRHCTGEGGGDGGGIGTVEQTPG
jgi:hypothetical protein